MGSGFATHALLAVLIVGGGAFLASPAGNTALAGVYKWVDDEGLTHYSDTQPEDSTFEEVSIDAGSYTGARFAPSNVYAGADVVMLSARWCAVCKKARGYFQRNGIPFREYDIERNSTGKRLYETAGAKAVPVIFYGQYRMLGFTEDRFAAMYASTEAAGSK